MLEARLIAISHAEDVTGRMSREKMGEFFVTRRIRL